MIEKNKIMILCSICTLIFVSGGKGGCRACHMHLCQLRSPRGRRLDGFYFCLSFRKASGSIFGPQGSKKSRKIRHANTGLPSSRFLPRMLFVLKLSLTFCAHRRKKRSTANTDIALHIKLAISHIIATSWQPGPRTVQDSCHGCCLC